MPGPCERYILEKNSSVTEVDSVVTVNCGFSGIGGGSVLLGGTKVVIKTSGDHGPQPSAVKTLDEQPFRIIR